ncbi:MAG: DUF2726 domain-containing protein [Candidatus Nomurabacteria bacterium]|jgi:very-short-patch-repair endonuclease|nr:DUF2726 domain-containing protein [Candidatus Nomurabacteria bacterium]
MKVVAAIIIASAALLLVVDKFSWHSSNVRRSYHYRRKNYMMTPAENIFYEVLLELVGANLLVWPQVHLSEIVDWKINGQNWRAALAVIQRKSVDFVIADRARRRTLLAIELDDSSHQQTDRRQRDELVETILAEAGVPLLRVKNSAHYDKAKLKSQIISALVN